jgi:hypothetical protein
MQKIRFLTLFSFLLKIEKIVIYKKNDEEMLEFLKFIFWCDGKNNYIDLDVKHFFCVFFRIRILPSTSKTKRENLDFYRFVTFL